MPTMSQNDFDKLCQSIKDSVSAFTKMVPDAASSFSQTIKDSVSTFTKNLNDGLGEAGNAFNEGLGQAFGKDSTPKPSEAPKQTGFSSPTAQQNPATPVATNARSAAPVPFVNNSLARSRFRSSMGLSISGVILIILGAAGTFAFGLT